MFIKKFMNGRNIAPKKIIQITAGRSQTWVLGIHFLNYYSKLQLSFRARNEWTDEKWKSKK